MSFLFQLLWLLVVSLGLFFGGKYILHASAKPVSPTPITLFKTSPSPVSASPTIAQSTGLQEVVQSALDGTSGTYGVYVKDMATGETYAQDEHHVFVSGSLYKLWVMAVVYQQIAAGNLHLDDVLSKDAADLNAEFAIDPDLADQTSGPITYSVKDALYQMITISDNDSALLLTDKVGLSKIAAFLRTNGLAESAVGINGENPTTTASDIGHFFEKLYSGNLGTSDTTQAMIDLLKQQKLNEKIPLNLPEDLEVAHKTGEMDDFSHDAGILFIDGHPTIVVVLSQTDDTDAANSRIAAISQAVYQYFSK